MKELRREKLGERAVVLRGIDDKELESIKAFHERRGNTPFTMSLVTTETRVPSLKGYDDIPESHRVTIADPKNIDALWEALLRLFEDSPTLRNSECAIIKAYIQKPKTPYFISACVYRAIVPNHDINEVTSTNGEKKVNKPHDDNGSLKTVKAFRITDASTGEVVLETALFTLFNEATGGGHVSGHTETIVLEDDTEIDISAGFIDYHPDFNGIPNRHRAACYSVQGGCLIDTYPRKDDWLKTHLEKRNF